MAENEFIDQMARQAGKLFRAPEVPADLEENLKALLQSGFSRMNLVSRDEFDAQTAVLARTRQRLEQLENQLKTFEKQLQTVENPD